MKQDAKFQWTEKCESKLQDLKNALINALILAPFRGDRKVYIYTDESLFGLGAYCPESITGLFVHESRVDRGAKNGIVISSRKNTNL